MREKKVPPKRGHFWRTVPQKQRDPRNVTHRASDAACPTCWTTSARGALVDSACSHAARRAGARYADLIEGPEQITWSHVNSAGKIGLTAGASAPEEMVAAVIAALQGQFSLDILEVGGGPENVHFNLIEILKLENLPNKELRNLFEKYMFENSTKTVIDI